MRRGKVLDARTGLARDRSRTPAATCSRWSIRLLIHGRSCWCLLDAGSRELPPTDALDGVEPGGRTAPFSRSSSAGGRGVPPRPRGFLTDSEFESALTCIIGARLAWIALMISSVLIPWRYTLVVDTYECPSWRWITGRGTPSRASSTAELMVAPTSAQSPLRRPHCYAEASEKSLLRSVQQGFLSAYSEVLEELQ
jgi:hypothetical protein